MILYVITPASTGSDDKSRVTVSITDGTNNGIRFINIHFDPIFIFSHYFIVGEW